MLWKIINEFEDLELKSSEYHVCVLPCLKSSCSREFFFSSLYFCCRNSILGHSHILRLLARITASFLRGSCKEKTKSEYFYKSYNTSTSTQTAYYFMFICLGKGNAGQTHWKVDNLQMIIHCTTIYIFHFIFSLPIYIYMQRGLKCILNLYAKGFIKSDTEQYLFLQMQPEL